MFATSLLAFRTMAQLAPTSPIEDRWRTKLTPENRDKIIRLLKEGLSPTVVARRFGVTPPTIRLVRKNYYDSLDQRKESDEAPRKPIPLMGRNGTRRK